MQHTGMIRFHALLGVAALWLAAYPARADAPTDRVAAATLAAPGTDAQTCPLCRPDFTGPVYRVTPTFAESLAHDYATRNRRTFASIDSLLRSGVWGAADGRGAQDKAHLLARLRALNSYHYLTSLANDPDRVYEADESTLTELFKSYADVGLYPIARLKNARMGNGRICAQYDLTEDLERRSRHGQIVRVGEVRLGSETRRMLSMTLPTALFDDVEILVGEHFACRVEVVASGGPPAPYRLYVLDDIEGMLLRKWGTHKPRALTYWTSEVGDARHTLPSTPLVGSCIYVPGIQLQLPAKLPNIGLENLRSIDLPQPIVDVSYARGSTAFDWLPRRAARGFKGWKAHGPIPPDVRRRFPEPRAKPAATK